MTKGEMMQPRAETSSDKRYSDNELFDLFRGGKLLREVLIKEAQERGVGVDLVAKMILSNNDLTRTYQKNLKTFGKVLVDDIERQEILLSFLEKIQKERSAVSEERPPSIKSDESSVQNDEPVRIEKEESSTVNPDIDSAPEEEPAPIDEPVRIETGEPQPVVHNDVSTGDRVTEPEQPIEESTQPDIEPASEPAQQDDAVAENPELPEDVSRPEKQDWWEVKRETEVMAIEDLDGNMDKFREHVARLGIAEEGPDGSWKWTGGNRKLVFLGDILGDCCMNGIEITFAIASLAEQAREAGGRVDQICGNHDSWFIDFLANEGYEKEFGLWELVRFDPNLDSELRRAVVRNVDGSPTDEFTKRNRELYDRMPVILESMRTDPEGRRLLENICNLEVVVVHDDTLYCHTDPTGAMIRDLTKDGDIARRTSEINTIFQKNLRRKLFLGEDFDDEFKAVERIYLFVGNREYFTEEEVFMEDLNERLDEDMKESEVDRIVDEWKRAYKLTGEYALQAKNILVEINAGNMERARRWANEIKDGIVLEYVERVRISGVNSIIHGHSSTAERNYDANDLIIVSPHSHFRVNGTNRNWGVLTVKTNGRIELFGRSFRENRLEGRKTLTGKSKRKRSR